VSLPAPNHLVSREGAVARITLNRLAAHNALDEALIADLTATLEGLAREQGVRFVVLTGGGETFCAGGDLNWMRRTADYSLDENLADARRLAGVLQALDCCPKPTLALVNGPAYGGGIGLIACCDVAIAVDSAKFSLSEVRLGLLPATISPYVVGKIGRSAARRYFLTAEVFGAAEARRIGLIHEVVPASALEDAGDRLLKRLAEGAPGAQSESKRLIARTAGAAIDDALIEETARCIARRRATAEGKEGARAFLDKRKPSWRE
jgi:methylglutaconyl-CoA hydratase